jgi:hypothetical protein
MPHAALTPIAPTDRAASLPPPPTAAKPRGTPWRTAIAEARAAHTNAASSPPVRPLVPITPYPGDSLLERELAGRSAGLCASAIRPSPGAPRPGPTAPFKLSHIDPVNREPPAKPGSTAPFKPFRTDPFNREPTAKPGSTVPFKPFRTDPLNREPKTKPGPTAPFKPFRIDPLNREPGAFLGPDPGQCIASMNPLIAADPGDAPRTWSQRRRQEIFAADERR